MSIDKSFEIIYYVYPKYFEISKSISQKHISVNSRIYTKNLFGQ